jgi:V8-like Glu-specific endopeptidase
MMKTVYMYGISSAAAAAILVVSAGFAYAAGSVSHRPSKMHLSSWPSGPLLERLPKTNERVTVIGGRAGSTSVITDKAGSSKSPKSSARAFGSATEKWPYTISRVAVQQLGPSSSAKNTPVTSRPYRLTGKLEMRFGSQWFICSASLIEKSVLITAAHCVHDFGLGQAGFADEVIWHPANVSNPDTTTQPFGTFTGAVWSVPQSYFDGTDTCESGASGVVCNNDLATVVLEKRGGQTAADILGGTYGYGWNGFSSIKSPAFGNVTVADITQLGYPGALDKGFQMQRNNSFGKTIISTGSNGKTLKQVQLGSAMTGGSSGGPWMVNFGTRPSVDTSEASLGKENDNNIVVGVTSWGLTAVGLNVQGSSFFGQNPEFPNADYGGFGAGNIGFMVKDACVNNPGAC